MANGPTSVDMINTQTKCDDDVWQAIKDAYREQVKNTSNQNQPCPSCGACPTCGRSGYQTVPYYQPYPYYPTPWWQAPYTVTCEGVTHVTGVGTTWGNQ